MTELDEYQRALDVVLRHHDFPAEDAVPEASYDAETAPWKCPHCGDETDTFVLHSLTLESERWSPVDGTDKSYDVWALHSQPSCYECEQPLALPEGSW